MEKKPDCDLCRKANEVFGREPDCESCLPDVMVENELPLEIYGAVCNQHIMGPSGPVDMNIVALDAVMGWYGVKDKLKMSTRVLSVYRKILGDARKQRELANG